MIIRYDEIKYKSNSWELSVSNWQKWEWPHLFFASNFGFKWKTVNKYQIQILTQNIF